MIVTCLERLGAAATEKPSAKLYKFNTRARSREACDEVRFGECAVLGVGCAEGACGVVGRFGMRNRLSVSHGCNDESCYWRSQCCAAIVGAIVQCFRFDIGAINGERLGVGMM